MKIRLPLLLLVLFVAATSAEAKPASPVASPATTTAVAIEREVREVSGWKVHINKVLMGADAAATEQLPPPVTWTKSRRSSVCP